jgi:DNA-binding NarL/FixJ family response regulator
MRSVRFNGKTSRHLATSLGVSIAGPDAPVVRRIADALSGAGIDVLDRVPDVAGLSDHTAAASAILLAGSTAGERRTLIRAANERFPDVPTVVIASASTNGIHKALEAGACGVVLESEIESALPATVRAICAGQVVVPHQFRRHAIRPALSHREKEALVLVASGMTNRQIASHLFLAESTVKTHLTSIFGKLGVCSRSEAAALVLDPETKVGLGLLGLPMAASTNERNGESHS